MATAGKDAGLDSENNGDAGGDPKKRESKKRRFKAFSAVRKFFKGGRKRKSTVTDEENHHASNDQARPTSASVCLSGDKARVGDKACELLEDVGSMSDDSVLSSEEKEAISLQTQDTAALLNPNLSKMAFQTELSSKLSDRRSQCLDEDEDDSLLHGQAPPVSNTDVTVTDSTQTELSSKLSDRRSQCLDEDEDDSLLHGQAPPVSNTDVTVTDSTQTELSSKLSNRRSQCLDEDEDDSLRHGQAPLVSNTDVTVADSTQEDLFQSQWKSGVPSAGSLSSSGPVSQETPIAWDLNEMERTELLRSDIAKDRISVKPRARRPSWQSLKNREGRHSFSFSSLGKGDPSRGQTPNHAAGRPRSEHIDPSVLSDFDVHMFSSAKSAMELTRQKSHDTTTPSQQGGTQRVPTNITTSSSDAHTSVESTKHGITKVHSKRRSSVPFTDTKTHRVSFAAEEGVPENLPIRNSVTEVIVSSPVIELPKGKEREIMAVNVSTPTDSSSTAAAAAAMTVTSREVKSSMTHENPSPSIAATSSSSASVSPERKTEDLMQADIHTADAFSPKPHYKIRRQQRSKTLPAQQSSVTVQRTASQRVGATNCLIESVMPAPEETSSKDAEPDCFSLARRKTQRQNEEAEPSAPPARDISSQKEPILMLAPSTIATGNTDLTSTARNATVTSSVATAAPPSAQSVSRASETASIVIGSSTTAGQEGGHQHQDAKERRGGSLKSTMSNTQHFHAKDSSVMVTPAKFQPSSSLNLPSSPSLLLPGSSSISFSASSDFKQNQEQIHSPQHTFPQDAPEWKTQSTNALSRYLPRTSSTEVPPELSTTPLFNKKTSAHIELPTSARTETRPTSSRPTSSLVDPQSQVGEKKSSTPASRTEMIQRTLPLDEVKIELIEISPDSMASSSSSSSKTTAEPTLRQDSVTKGKAGTKELHSDQCGTSVTPTRHSRVKDLLKNFENVQGVS